jgi:simple sugar transport system ATP-binding protein
MHPSGPEDREPLISLRGVSKRFGSLWANQDISLDFYQGEIHAIVGENGAGKSTLMKILNGHLRPDAGEVRLNGQGVVFRSPREAMRAGMGMAYQQMLFFPQLTALENVIVGFEPGPRGWINRRQASEDLARLCQSVGFDLPLNALASELVFAHRQQIEILRLLHRRVRVLILDEPTSLLSPPETERLLALLKSLQASGLTILFVSHRLREVFAVADRVSILSRGKAVGSFLKSEVEPPQLVQLIMSAGNPDPILPQPSWQVPAPDSRIPYPELKPVLLEIKSVTTLAAPYDAGFEGFSLNIMEGEVFGLGGVVGNGQRTLALLLSGLLPVGSGSVFLSGEEITYGSIRARAQLGVRWLPANPLEEALLPSRSLWENLLMGCQRQRPFQHNGWIHRPEIDAWAQEHLRRHEVVYGSIADSVNTLSGGNQQKIALSRVLEGAPRLIILEQPARGLDLRAQERLRNQVRQLSARGATFLLISYDLEELLALSHRIGVLYRGRMMGIAKREDASPELLGNWMLGFEGNP